MVLLSSVGSIWIWDQTVKWVGASHQVRIKNGVCLRWGTYSEGLKTGLKPLYTDAINVRG